MHGGGHALEVREGHGAPEARVGAIVPVVAEHEQVPVRDAAAGIGRFRALGTAGGGVRKVAQPGVGILDDTVVVGAQRLLGHLAVAGGRDGSSRLEHCVMGPRATAAPLRMSCPSRRATVSPARATTRLTST